MKNKEDVKKYYCYSSRQRKFIDQNGTRWVDKGINKISNRPYWVFEQSTRLGEILKRYKNEN